MQPVIPLRFRPEGIGRLGRPRVPADGASAFASIVFPALEKVLPVGLYGGPIFFFEPTMRCWLVIKSCRTPATQGRFILRRR